MSSKSVDILLKRGRINQSSYLILLVSEKEYMGEVKAMKAKDYVIDITKRIESGEDQGEEPPATQPRQPEALAPSVSPRR